MNEEFQQKKRAQKYRSTLSGRDLRASTLGWEIATPIVLGPLLGYFLDQRLGTDILLTLICIGLGFIAAVYLVIRYIRYEQVLTEMQQRAQQAEKEAREQEEREAVALEKQRKRRKE